MKDGFNGKLRPQPFRRPNVVRGILFLGFVVLLLAFPKLYDERGGLPRYRSLSSSGRGLCERTMFLGGQYAGYTVCSSAGSLRGGIVYSVGVGRSILWDKEMIAEFGTVHHGWDPSPTATGFFKNHGQPDGYTFHEYGLGPIDGTVAIKLPKGSLHDYCVLGVGNAATPGSVHNVEMRTARTMMAMLGHKEIAVLKMDIEGSEVEVIEEWVLDEYRVPAEQVVIEFHEGHFAADVRDTVVPRAVKQMEKLGFKEFHRAKWGKVRYISGKVTERLSVSFIKAN